MQTLMLRIREIEASLTSGTDAAPAADALADATPWADSSLELTRGLDVIEHDVPDAAFVPV